ncbi:MAG: LysM peptidoglycan-binding domain-containing protein [Anaerolineaceae bacterium]|nr:LysM peptidoglycan-binding domain-containing protein [Anaerolineaceae bacterium]
MRRPILIFLIFLSLFTVSSAAFADKNDSFREGLLDRLNKLRGHYGCSTLVFDSHLQTAAQHQAEFLAEIGTLQSGGPAGESVRERAIDAGYGGEKSFSIRETNAMVWVDTDLDYLIEEVLRVSQASVRVLFDPELRQIGIGVGDAPDKHRYIVLTLAELDDGTLNYDITRPTYDYRTPKPTISATPSPEPFMTSTANPDGGVYHVVQEGETFSEIALAYGLDWYTLSIRNNIKLSDTTPVVIMEGQVLVIEPTFTLTPTPTPTKTPVPPTVTPRPTFTADPNLPSVRTLPTAAGLPAPDFGLLLNHAASWKKTVGWILIGVCIPGLFFTLRKK